MKHWNIERITKVWHRDMESANAFGKNGTCRLVWSSYHKLSICKKQYLQSTIKQSTIKWGMPVLATSNKIKKTILFTGLEKESKRINTFL